MSVPAMLNLSEAEEREYRENIGGPAFASLNPFRREFVLQYVLGPEGVRGVAYKSYLKAGYAAKSDDVASSAAYQLLHNVTVVSAIAEVRAHCEQEFKDRVQSWQEMAFKASTLLNAYFDTIAGLRTEKTPDTPPIILTATSLAAIQMTLDRAHGRPVQPVSHDTGPNINELIKRISTSRRADRQLGAGAAVSGRDGREIALVPSDTRTTPPTQEE